MATPYSPNLSATPRPAWGRGDIPFTLNEDPGPLWRQERQFSRIAGDRLAGEFEQDANAYRPGEAGYSDLVSNLYGDIWSGGGGYTPEMQKNILQQEGLDRVDAGLDDGYLTDAEQAGVRGDPMGAFNLGRGYAGNIEGVAQTTGQQQMGYLPYVQGAQDAWQDRLAQSYDQAIQPDRLRSSGAYAGNVRGALAGAEGAVNDPGLSLSDEYRRQAYVSDQEVDDLEAAGVRDAVAGYQSGADRLYRDAKASGMVSPQAQAAMRLEYERAGAAAGSDAGLQARLAARGVQRDAAQRIQDTELGAAGNRAGLGLNLAGMEIGAEGDIEGRRMAGEQDVANRLTSAGETLSGRGTDNARYYGDLAIGTAGEAGDRTLGAYQYNANLIPSLYAQGEQQGSDRAAMLGTNRQGTSQFNTNARLNINDSTSGRYQTAYNPWLANQEEGRAAATGQQGYFGGRTQDTNQLRLGTFQTQQQGQQGALQGYNQWKQIDKQPGKVAQGFQIASNFINSASNASNAAAVRGF